MACLLVACVIAIVKLGESIVSKTVNSFMYYGHFMLWRTCLQLQLYYGIKQALG